MPCAILFAHMLCVRCAVHVRCAQPAFGSCKSSKPTFRMIVAQIVRRFAFAPPFGVCFGPVAFAEQLCMFAHFQNLLTHISTHASALAEREREKVEYTQSNSNMVLWCAISGEPHNISAYCVLISMCVLPTSGSVYHKRQKCNVHTHTFG